MTSSVTAFLADEIIASGERQAVTEMIEEGYPADFAAIIVIEDATGQVTDLDYWDALSSSKPRPRGRPKLGVQAREVTLLPRHWDWLTAQTGGASATLRLLVENAQRQPRNVGGTRKEAIYRFLQATCGNKPHYEDVLRALYQDDEQKFRSYIATWPDDIRAYLARLSSSL